jgi:DNA-binding NarL/FixJ family response regulator
MEPATDPTIPAPPDQVTVVVAHADAGRRDQLARWLESDGRFAVLGRAGDAGEATALIVTAVPDLAFVDIDLPPGSWKPTRDAPAPTVADGVASIALLTERRPSVRLIAVTDRDDDRAYAAMLAGAIGCYQWDAPVGSATELAAGVARGEGALTAGWAGRILDEIRWLGREPGPVPAPELTPTELEVLRRTSKGATATAVAELHGVTTHLVDVNAATAIIKVWRHHDDVRRLQRLRDV